MSDELVFREYPNEKPSNYERVLAVTDKAEFQTVIYTSDTFLCVCCGAKKSYPITKWARLPKLPQPLTQPAL